MPDGECQLFTGKKMIERTMGLDDHQKHHRRMVDLTKDVRGLQAAQGALDEEVDDAEENLRKARAAVRENKACVEELKNEMLLSTEACGNGKIREEREVREVFIRGEVTIFDLKTGAELSKRQASDKEWSKAQELKDKKGIPLTGQLVPEGNELPPMERAKQKTADKKDKKASAEEPTATQDTAALDKPAPKEQAEPTRH